MITVVIRNAQLVNEGLISSGDLLIKDGRIAKVGGSIEVKERHEELPADGLYLIPGVIDDQVHFREPGLTHKADLFTESRAAMAGGITSFMEMPNTMPPVLTQSLLQEKYALGAARSLANFSFYMGVSNDNVAEVLKTDPEQVCGIKIFLGSSTGNLLVDNVQTLETLFEHSPMLIATHCEDEATIRSNLETFLARYGENIPVGCHPLIRSHQACYLSSSYAVNLARKYGTRLHVLHLSTARETFLFDNTVPLAEKNITAEVCIHHLWFSDADYPRLGNRIKWNPAIKTDEDRQALLQALLDDRIDVIATDHAPHTLEEKNQPYRQAPSGGPLVQHALPAMLEMVNQKKISIEKVVEKMCHAPAICYRIKERGFLREGYYADLTLVDLNRRWKVTADNLLYKCRWSPFEDTEFSASVVHTFVNGQHVFNNGKLDDSVRGMRLTFERERRR
jgi:dihydroorotase